MTAPGRVLVGTAGWSYADWSGRVYPDPRPRGFDELRYLAGHLDCLEVNSTFYRVPARRTVEGWAGRVAHLREFVFTAKVHRSFTHGAEGEAGAHEARGFLEALRPLAAAGRLGALLLQFPWSFRDGSAARSRVARLCEHFREHPLVVEVRHASFGTPEAGAFLAALGAGIAEPDMPAAASNYRPRGTPPGPLAYVRLHGRNADAWFDPEAGRDARYDYLYSAGEIDAVAARVRALAAVTPTVFVVTNNHFRGQGPTNSFMLRARLLGRRVPVPPDLLEAYPLLRECAEPPPPGRQRTLFG